MKDTKKKIAAITAVAQYLKTQEEAAALVQAQSQDCLELVKSILTPPPSPMNLWGLGGRQHQMQLRTMMQLKAFHGSKRI